MDEGSTGSVVGPLTQLANLNQHHLGPVKIIQSPGTNLGGYFYQYGYFIWTFLRYWSKSNRINITLTVSAYEAKQLLVLEGINKTIKKCCLRIKMTPSVRRICAFKTLKALRSYCIFYCNQVRLSDWLRLHLQLCICHRFIRSSQLFLVWMFRRTRVSSGLSGREGNTYVEEMAPPSLLHRPGLMADASTPRTTRTTTVTPKKQEAMPPQKTFTEKCWTWWRPSLWAFGWRDEMRWEWDEPPFFIPVSEWAGSSGGLGHVSSLVVGVQVGSRLLSFSLCVSFLLPFLILSH